MELQKLSESFLFIAILVLGLLPLFGVMLFRVKKRVRALVIVVAAFALLTVVNRPVLDKVLTLALPPTPCMTV